MDTRKTRDDDFEERATAARPRYGRLHKINWRAIVAGATATLGIQVLFFYLGTALGLSSFSADRAETFSDAAILGPIFFLLVAGLISAFAGGWVAGIFGNYFNRQDAYVHGGLTWALSAVLIALGLGTIAGLASSAVQSGSLKAQASTATPGAEKGSQQAGSLAYDRLNDAKFATFVTQRARSFADKADRDAINVSVDSREAKKENKDKSKVNPKDIAKDYELQRFVMTEAGLSKDAAQEFLKQDQETIAQAAADSQRQWEIQHAREIAKAETARRSAAQFAWVMTFLGLASLAITMAGTYLGWREDLEEPRNVE